MKLFRILLAAVLLLCPVAVRAACVIQSQAVLLSEFQTCLAQGKGQGCITPPLIQNLICSVPSLAGTASAVVFTGLTAGGANTYTIAAPSPTGFTLTDQFVVRAQINVTNTGASTLNVNGTGAIPIRRQSADALFALAGGELVAGRQYDFTYQAAANAYIVGTVLATGVTNNAATANITTQEWANGQLFVFTALGQTLIVPLSTTLPPNGGVIAVAVNNTVTVTPNGSDSINGLAPGASVVLPVGTVTTVTSDGAGHVYVPVTQPYGVLAGNQAWTGGNAVAPDPLTDGAAIAVNCALGNIFTVTLAGSRTLSNPTNCLAGQVLIFEFTQDATGSRVLTLGTNYKNPGGVAPVLTSTAGAIDQLACRAVSSGTSIMRCGSLVADIR